MDETVIRVGTRDGYDRWAGCYDAYANPLIALEEPVVRELMGEVQGLALCDLACGTGRHALHFAERGARTTGIDFSEGMLARARDRDRAGAVRWVAHDLRDPLPLEDRSFERVVHALALDHLVHPPALLAEIRRILRPGGRAVITVMHPAMFLKGTQARFVDPASGELVVIDNERHGISDHVNWIREAGLTIFDMREESCTAELADRIPRARKYVDWPMLLAMAVGAV